MLSGPAIIGRAATPATTWQADPFSLGVASGAPAKDGFVLWTRMMGAEGNAPLPVSYEIAADEGMRNLVRQGVAATDPAFGHSIHEEVTGLEAGRPYWYRFHSGAAQSAIGRAMTLPAPGADRLNFAYFSCSNWQSGYFSAYGHAAEEHPDFAVFLGDYIYEYIETRHPVVRAHSGGKEPRTIAEYRARYEQYRSDPGLRAIHAACPSLVTWDDHEVQNDYADQWSEDFEDPQAFLALRAAAYQAFYEHMPVKPAFSKPFGSSMRLYDSYDFGDLLRVHLIDGRQYRSREACYRKPDKGGGHVETAKSCPELLDLDRSMIGAAQEKWLFDGLANSKARWNVIANDVLMARLNQPGPDGEPAYWTDDWDGYPASRNRLLISIHDRKPSNPVVITGDIHSFWTNDLKLDFNDPKSPVVATEFVGTSVSSDGPPYDVFSKFLTQNPHVKFFESRRRGYVSVALTPKRMDTKYQVVSDVTDPNATRSTLAAFAVEDGKPGAETA
jgi:alkaline phosphatase D